MIRTASGNRENRRGAVLITALAFTVVVSCIIAGIAAFTMSHCQRATTEGDYASALNMAEAGINWEIRKMSQTSISADTVSNPASQSFTYPGIVSGFNGTFKAWVTNDPDTGTQWTAPNSAIVWGQGIVNGVVANVQRSVNIK